MRRTIKYLSLPQNALGASKVSGAARRKTPVPVWLWSEAERLFASKTPWLKAAGPGLVANRPANDKGEQTYYEDVFNPWFNGWAASLAEAEVEAVERTLCTELFHHRAALARVSLAGFPEERLREFAIRRELFEATTCLLVARETGADVIEELDAFDRHVAEVIMSYLEANPDKRWKLLQPRDEPLLILASERDDQAWWGRLAVPQPDMR